MVQSITRWFKRILNGATFQRRPRNFKSIDCLESRVLLVSEWTQAGGNAQHTNFQDVAFDPSTFVLDWSQPDTTTSVAVDATHIYMTEYGTNGPMLVARDRFTGVQVWSTDLPGISYEGASAPSVHNGVVYVSRAGHSAYSGIGEPRIYGLDAATGAIVSYRAYSAQWGSTERPVISGNHLIAEDGYYGGISSFDLPSLARSWSVGGWQSESLSAAVDDEYVYAYGAQVFDLDDGSHSSIVHPDGYSAEGPMVTPSGAVVYSGFRWKNGEYQAAVFAVDGNTHSVLWTWPLPPGNGADTGKAVGNGVIAIVTGQQLFLLNEATGTLIRSWFSADWFSSDRISSERLNGRVILTRTHAFVGSDDYPYQTVTVRAIDLLTGQSVWSDSDTMGNFRGFDLALVGGQLFLSGPNSIRSFSVPNQPPVASAGSDTSSSEGSPVSFDGSSSSDPEGRPLTYHWDYGDGSVGSGMQPTHTYADNGSYTVTLTVTDVLGASSQDTLTATITNVAPTVEIVSPNAGLLGSDQQFSFTATDVSPTDQAGSFEYQITWGDGSPVETHTGTSSLQVTHRFETIGNLNVSVIVTDEDGEASSSASSPISITATTLENGLLKIVGTSSRDTILLTFAGGTLSVNFNGELIGDFSGVTGLSVDAREGDDTVSVPRSRRRRSAPTLAIPAIVFGATGNDVIDFSGSSGPNILVGGWGADTVRGGADNDLLIGDATVFDLDANSLNLLMSEWQRKDSDFRVIVDRLSGVTTDGMNNGVFLNSYSLIRDDQIDLLSGDSGNNWFVLRSGANTDLISRAGRKKNNYVLVLPN